MSTEEILEKVKKLLALANSDNEHESRLAAQKANEILVKYNLTMQQTLEARPYVEEEIKKEKRMNNDEFQLLRVAVDHFFVHVILSRSRDTKAARVIFLGDKANVATAIYIHEFLLRTVRESFKKAREENGLTEKMRVSFTTGFVKGVAAQLREQRRVTETKMAMTIVPDPKLKDFVNEKYSKAKERWVTRGGDEDAISHGYQVGTKTQIRRGIGETGKNIGGIYLNK